MNEIKNDQICDETLDFLRQVVPVSGIKFVGLMRAGSPGVEHLSFTDLTIMAKAVRKYDKHPGTSVFFACSSYRSESVDVPDQKHPGQTKKSYRVAGNVLAAKALWADVDVGEDKAAKGAGYANKKAAVVAFKRLLHDTGLPMPLIVSSGVGFHLYWLFTQEVDSGTWQRLAGQLKSIFKHFGFLADPTRTADATSILRPPGSTHKKDPACPKAVEVKTTGEAVTPDAMGALLDLIVSAHGIAAGKLHGSPTSATSRESKAFNAEVSQHAGQSQKPNANLVADNCAQMEAFRNGDALSYGHWFAAAQVAKRCENGEQVAHEWSGKDPRYDPAETQQKLDSGTGGPPTCAHFASLNPQGCSGCVHQGKINTPWVLGLAVKTTPSGVIADSVGASEDDRALAHLQGSYALISLGGNVGFVDIESTRKRQKTSALGALAVLNRESGVLLLKRAIAQHYPKADSAACIRRFMASPNTKMYDGVDFTPGTPREGSLNLHVGPTLIPAKGKWGTLETFVLEDICNGDGRVYAYLIRFIAHALQFPGIKPGVMITLIGGQGTGKGTIFALITKIWAATTLLTSRIDDVAGEFNEAMEGSVWVLLDEVFALDKRTADGLKAAATTPVVRINPKGQTPRSIPSTHRFMMATNHNHAANREHDDRRDVTLRVSDKHKGNRPYWTNVHAAIGSETAAMMYDLIRMDLSGFNVAEKPDTDELTKQKLRSLPPVEAFWHNCLYNGTIKDGHEWVDFVGSEELCKEVKEFSKGVRAHAALTTDAMVSVIRKICPEITRAQRSFGSRRVRGLVLPSLEVCRAAFEGYIGGEIEW